MGFFLVKRLLTLIITLVATSVIVFAVLEILPGNAAQVLMGPDADRPPSPPRPSSWGWISPPCPATCTGSAGCCAATWACPTPTAPRSPS
jgi:peptide/nickel transport system permease protein